MSDSRPIGIFDSGLGGLTVLKEIRHILPQEQIIYFGDTARVPYGPKSRETVLKFSIENILFLLKHKVKLIVVACNTSSSVALNRVENSFRVPIIGVIKPGAEQALNLTRNGRIGIIGTRTTIRSRAYEKQIKQKKQNMKIYSVACPLFVPLVEEGWTGNRITREIARMYLAPFKKYRIDTLVLGCTHYPLLKNVIKEVLGARVRLVDSAKQVAKQVSCILKDKQMLALGNRTKRPKIHFFVSDEPASFAKLGKKFLGIPLKNVKVVSNV
ncbi:MAG: glutamate racemase [Candidatus Omnitrophica bacterium]|nr:glutamate racemase [Candidatus Omnitrophota bacterium]